MKTQTISREWLETTISEMESARDEMPFGLDEDGSNTLAALKLALAGMGSEPVAWQYRVSAGHATGWSLWHEGKGEPYEKSYQVERRALYAAPPAPVMHGELHPDTQKLVADFCTALAEKLYKAQLKYGWSDNWMRDNWRSECMQSMQEHIAKGDPRDVAAYCAFMWYHGWKTDPVPVAISDGIGSWDNHRNTPTDKPKSELLQRAENLAEKTAALAQQMQSEDLRAKVRADHAEWAAETFGNTGPVGPLKHLSKEALEAAEAPWDLHEWADMQFLFWDAQRKAGVTDEQITEAMLEKLEINKCRSWPEPKDGEPRLHIKSEPEQEV